MMTRMGLKMHLWMCKYCHRYFVQLRFIRETLGRYDEQLESEAEAGDEMPDNLRERLDALVQESTRD